LSIARAEPFDSNSRHRTRRPLRDGVSRLLAVVRNALPQHCELCAARADGAMLCHACFAALPRVAAPCPACALPTTDGATCGACLRDPPPYTETVAAFAYAFPVDRMIQKMKYGGSTALAHWAGAALAMAVQAKLGRGVSADRPQQVVALPLSAPRQRERGFNQAREIAARVAAATALPIATPLLRVPGGLPQAALPWAERRGNVRGAFALTGEVRDIRFALVDDVMTTGATLAEAARTLVAAGAARVDCWVVARTLRPGPD